MLKMLFLTLVYSICLVALASGKEVSLPHFSRSLTQGGIIEHRRWRDAIRENGMKRGFIHVKEIMSALSQGERNIEVSIKKDEIDMRGLEENDPELFFKQMLHNTNAKYTLLDENQVKTFMSLDEAHHAQSIREISSDTMTHCAKFSLQVGDIILASEHGNHVHSTPSDSTSLSQFMQSPQMQRNEDFKMIRRVTSVKNAAYDDARSTSCVTYQTEDLSPLEIFSHFTVDVDAKSPFQHYDQSYDSPSSSTSATDAQHRHLAEPASLPKCVGSVGKEGTSHWTFNLTKSHGCIEYNRDLPGSIAINYKLGHGVLKKNLDITEGRNQIVCTSCYAFFGAAIRMQISYISPNIIPPTFGRIDLLATLAGGAGYNLDLNIQNPTLSGSNTIELLSGDTAFISIPIFPSFWLKFKVDKLSVTVSGTGSANGTASAKSGSEATLSMGLWGTWDGPFTGNWRLPTSFNTKSVTPQFTFSEFKIVSFGIRVDLLAAINMGVTTGIAGLDLNVNFIFEVIPWVAYSRGMDGKSKFSVVLDKAAAPSRDLLESLQAVRSTVHLRRNAPRPSPPTPPTPKVYYIGDKVPITIPYEGLNPNEPITVFYAINAVGQDKPISLFTKDFIVSASGKGSFVTDYILPAWDIFYTSDPLVKWTIRVHMSHYMTYNVDSDTSFTVSTQKSIFTAGVPNDGTIVDTDVPISLSWNPADFHHFKAKNAFIGAGTDFPTNFLSVSLMTGTRQSPVHVMGLQSFVPNQGSTSVIIPSNATKWGSNFFLAIYDAERNGVYGMSNGTFRLRNHREHAESEHESEHEHEHEHAALSSIDSHLRQLQSPSSGLGIGPSGGPTKPGSIGIGPSGVSTKPASNTTSSTAGPAKPGSIGIGPSGVSTKPGNTSTTSSTAGSTKPGSIGIGPSAGSGHQGNTTTGSSTGSTKPASTGIGPSGVSGKPTSPPVKAPVHCSGNTSSTLSIGVGATASFEGFSITFEGIPIFIVPINAKTETEALLAPQVTCVK